MTLTLTKANLKDILEKKLVSLAREIEDIGNAHFVAIEMLKDSIYEENEEKERYYRMMSDKLYEKLEGKRNEVDRMAYVYKSMFGVPTSM